MAGLTDATCPKSFRHSSATLLQDANVDPLIRQITLGHASTGTAGDALGMTSIYTHTRPETRRKEILARCVSGLSPSHWRDSMPSKPMPRKAKFVRRLPKLNRG